jgi:hypothetical protein
MGGELADAERVGVVADDRKQVVDPIAAAVPAVVTAASESRTPFLLRAWREAGDR